MKEASGADGEQRQVDQLYYSSAASGGTAQGVHSRPLRIELVGAALET